jgi:RNA polymerase sigma factor (sigma-70 family)
MCAAIRPDLAPPRGCGCSLPAGILHEPTRRSAGSRFQDGGRRLGQGRTTTGEADALLDAIRAGDSAALGSLYDQAGAQAYGLAFRILRDGPAAEDAVQEAFISLWMNASRLDSSRGRLVSYLLTLVHHKAVDLARSRASRDAHTSSADPADFGAIDRDFVSDVISAADGRAIRDSMQRLPEEQRRPIELAYFEGRSCPEIADAMGVPIGTVKSRLRLGLQKLRIDLESRGYP